ncbi:MAG: DinB family protein [Chitinophagaceae bacterium]
MKEQLLEAWRTNQRMNILVINNTTDTGMQKSLSTRGGRTIFQQWIHIHNVRMQWLEITAKDIFARLKVLDKDMPYDKKTLLKSLEDSFKGIEEMLGKSWDDGGKVKGFKKGVIPFLGYFISHESHHRGNILLTLKQSGEKIPDTLKWGLWEWGK